MAAISPLRGFYAEAAAASLDKVGGATNLAALENYENFIKSQILSKMYLQQYVANNINNVVGLSNPSLQPTVLPSMPTGATVLTSAASAMFGTSSLPMSPSVTPAGTGEMSPITPVRPVESSLRSSAVTLQPSRTLQMTSDALSRTSSQPQGTSITLPAQLTAEHNNRQQSNPLDLSKPTTNLAENPRTTNKSANVNVSTPPPAALLRRSSSHQLSSENGRLVIEESPEKSDTAAATAPYTCTVCGQNFAGQDRLIFLFAFFTIM